MLGLGGRLTSERGLEKRLHTAQKALFRPDRAEALQELGVSVTSQPEKQVQAALIREIVLHHTWRFSFVTSEFCFVLNMESSGSDSSAQRSKEGKKSLPDVILERDGVLYLVELKARRDTSAISQVVQYRTLFQAHQATYAALLKEFPQAQCTDVRALRCAVLEPFVECSANKLEPDAKAAGVELWLYQLNDNSIQLEQVKL